MFKKVETINAIISLTQKLWEFKGYIFGFLTASSGIGFLTFFHSQLGVAITCGVIFAIVCFTALIIVNALKTKAGDNIEVRTPSNRLLRKLTPQDIYNGMQGFYNEEDQSFIYRRDYLIQGQFVENFYTCKKVNVDFLPQFVKEIKCEISFGWNENPGSNFKGKVLIEEDDVGNIKEIDVSDLNVERNFTRVFKIKKESFSLGSGRYISFSIKLDPIINKESVKSTILCLNIISFEV